MELNPCELIMRKGLFFYFIFSRFFTFIYQLLKAGADSRDLDFSGSPPLSIAAGVCSSSRSTHIVQSLLEGGADPNVYNLEGFLPLHKACTVPGDMGIVKALLNAGTLVNTPCPGAEFQLPVHLAAHQGHGEALRALTAVGGCLLEEKAKATRFRCVGRLLLDKNGDCRDARRTLAWERRICFVFEFSAPVFASFRLNVWHEVCIDTF